MFELKKYKKGEIVNINNFHFITKYNNPINENDNLLYIDLYKMFDCILNYNFKSKYLQGDFIKIHNEVFICINDSFKFDCNNFIKVNNIFVDMVYNYFCSVRYLFKEVKLKEIVALKPKTKIEKIIDEKCKLYESLNSAEKDKMMILINTLKKIPNTKMNFKFDINEMMKKLNEEICGNDYVKKEFIKYHV